VGGQERADVLTKLCDTGLLERVGDDYQVHDYLEYNPSGADIMAEREAERARKAAGRSKQGRAESGRITSGVPGGIRAESELCHTGPVPVPDPLLRECVSARARVIDGFAAFGVLTPDGHSIGEVIDRVVAYAAAAKRDAGEVATEAIGAFGKLSATWTVSRRTPQLMAKHWDSVQQVMGGHDPTPRPGQVSRGRPPEPDRPHMRPVAEVLAERRKRAGLDE
jgi:hypothetical protein